ncbi:MAG: SpoIID/LytB domain-containing protein [Rubricoccaceae bacterium]|nr:SpoIID/LytB domain-containing protein [Rubricoccaceae bacterium]
MRCFHRSLLFLIALLVSASQVSAQRSEPIIRVHVLARVAPQTLTVRATDGTLTIYSNRDDTPIHRLMSGESTTIERVGDRIRISTPGGTVQARVAEVVPSNHSTVDIRTGSHHRRYHGALSIEIDNSRRALRLVNYVPLEDYVASVVASEYPFQEIEGVKAQAVLARTYALRSREPDQPFDLEDDTRAQMYEGAERETSISREAVEATRGKVLTYRGSLAEALYYSSSGGHTASNEDIWNTRPISYLRGRPDPYDSAAPDHRWTTSVSAHRLLSALSQRYGGSVSAIETAQRAPSGHVTRVRLVNSRQGSITGSQFRSAVNATFGSRTLRSTNFSVERNGSHYVFHGKGFGHGVGMSQFGARGQALQGRSYIDILSFYFVGTTIDYIDSSLADQPLVTERSANRREYPPVVRVSDERDAAWSGRDESETTPRRTAW